MGLPGKLRHPTENIQGQGSAPHIALHLPSNMGTRGGGVYWGRQGTKTCTHVIPNMDQLQAFPGLQSFIHICTRAFILRAVDCRHYAKNSP